MTIMFDQKGERRRRRPERPEVLGGYSDSATSRAS
jgi:hypothetical protein